MEDQEQTSFTFEISNISAKKALIQSKKFSSGGCEWLVKVYPKGDDIGDHLFVYLCVANPESLRLGWKIRARYSLVLLNQSNIELCKISKVCELLCAQFSSSGRGRAVPLKKLKGKGNKLIVKVELKVVEVVHEGPVTGKETLIVGGFKVLYSQVVSVERIFMKHPDMAVNFRPKNHLVKTTYMNLLLGLIKTLNMPAHFFTETELNNAQSELTELTEAGFNLDWLKKNIDEISLERKKAITNGSRVRELEEHIKNLQAELDMEKIKSATSDAKVLSLEQEVSDLNTELNINKKKVKSCGCQNSHFVLLD